MIVTPESSFVEMEDGKYVVHHSLFTPEGEDMQIMMPLTVYGNIETDDLEAVELTVTGDISAISVFVEGDIKADEINVEDVTTNGNLEVSRIVADVVQVASMITVHEEMRAHVVECKDFDFHSADVYIDEFTAF